MANQQQAVTINAPGFSGIDQESSPFMLDDTYAWQAYNAVIDRYGRIGARKGILDYTTTNTPLGANPIESLYSFTSSAGVTTLLSAGNLKVMKGDLTLTDITVGSPTANLWKTVELGDYAYMFQDGHDPLVWDGSASTLAAQTGTIKPQCSAALAAFGRVWCGTASTMYFSDTLIGDEFDTGASGSLNLFTVWPAGGDNIIALAEFNNYLVIFGEHSIVIYQGADDPSTMTLYDVITGVGCIARDTVVSTGTDLYFLDHSGVRSLGRTIQAGSPPMSELSRGIRTAIMIDIDAETSNISAVFNPDEKHYILSFPDQGTTYCFDTRKLLVGEDGLQQSRITQWGCAITAGHYVVGSNKVWLGVTGGVAEYTGYNDGTTSTYDMVYASNPLDLEQSTVEKFWKTCSLLLVGGGTSGTLQWSLDYAKTWSNSTFVLEAVAGSEWNEAEYDEGAEFANSLAINRETFQLTGSGYEIIIRVTATIDGQPLSLQQVNVRSVMGATNG